MGSKQEEASLAELAYRILLSHNEPMYYRDIVDEILKIRKIKGKSPYHIVNSCMSQDGRFERVDKGIWGLSKWKYKDISFKYTLTVYCVKNGIITLTSYMRPYFPSTPEEIELVFVDESGKKIHTVLNNKVGKIIGFKDWFSKNRLNVNDVLEFGILDYEKGIYTVLIKREEVEFDLADVRDRIIEVIRHERKTMNTGEVIKKLPDDIKAKIKVDDVRRILSRENWLIEISDNLWVPKELLSDGEKLLARINILTRGGSEDYKMLLKDIFTYFGFNIKEVAFRENNLLLASASLDYKGYRFLVDGDTPANKKHENGLPIALWEDALDNLKADYFLFISHHIPAIVKNKNIVFSSIYTLKKLIEWHNEFPLSLFDFLPLFTSSKEEDRLSEIDRKRKLVRRRVNLLKDILGVLDQLSKKIKLIDMKTLMTNLDPQEKYTLEEVSEALKFLGVMPLGIITFTETNSFILNMKRDLAIRRLKSFIDLFIDKR